MSPCLGLSSWIIARREMAIIWGFILSFRFIFLIFWLVFAVWDSADEAIYFEEAVAAEGVSSEGLFEVAAGFSFASRSEEA